MRYRAYFKFWGRVGYYYTEWFDTLGEARDFVTDAGSTVAVFFIENEDCEVVA